VLEAALKGRPRPRGREVSVARGGRGRAPDRASAPEGQGLATTNLGSPRTRPRCAAYTPFRRGKGSKAESRGGDFLSTLAINAMAAGPEKHGDQQGGVIKVEGAVCRRVAVQWRRPCGWGNRPGGRRGRRRIGTRKPMEHAMEGAAKPSWEGRGHPEDRAGCGPGGSCFRRKTSEDGALYEGRHRCPGTSESPTPTVSRDTGTSRPCSWKGIRAVRGSPLPRRC